MTISPFTSTSFSKQSLTKMVSSSILLLLACFAASAQAQEAFVLEPNKPVERTMKGNETHVFQINLNAGQFLHVVIEQSQGFDLVITLIAPDETKLIEMDGRNGYLWREALSCVAESPGTYRLQLKGYNPLATVGTYKATITSLRQALAGDAKRIEAEKAFAQGRRLYEQSVQTLPEAVKHFQAATMLWREIGDKYWEAVALINLGWTQSDLSENDNARGSLTEALKLFQEAKDRTGEGKAHNGLGTVYKDLRAYDAARDSYEQAVAIRRELKDRRGEANSLNNLGKVLQTTGQFEKTREVYLQALIIQRELKNKNGEADVLGSLAQLENGLGNFEKARDTYEAALAIAREVKHRSLESLYLVALGGVYNFGLNQYEKAKDYFESGLVASRDAKYRTVEGLALNGLGIVLEKLNQYEKAAERYEIALALARETNNTASESLALSCLVSLYSRMKQHDKARDYAEQMVKFSERQKDPNSFGTALNSLATVYSNLGQFERSRDLYQQALTISREVKNSNMEMLALSGLGLGYYNLNDFEKARDYYQQTRSLAHRIKNRIFEYIGLFGMGTIDYRLNRYEEAKDNYEQALIISRELKNRLDEALMLDNLGSVYVELSYYEKGRDLHLEALNIFKEIKDRDNESNTLNNVGRAWFALSQYDKARDYVEQALAIKLELNKQDKAVMLSNLGVMYNNLNQYEKAKGFLDEAALVSRDIRNRVTEGLILRGMGGLYYNDRSQYEKARGYYEQALAISREAKDKRGEASALDNLGTVDRNLGQYEKARDEYHQALTIFRDIKNRSAEGALLHNLGTLYNSLSQYDKALDYFNQALPIRRGVKDRRGEGATLEALGLVYKNLNQYGKAQDHFSLALAIFRELKVRGDEASSLNNLGDVSTKLNQHEQARGYLDQALVIEREIKDRRGEGTTLDKLGSVYKSLGQYEKARSFYEQALVIFREINVRQDEGEVLKHLMENLKLKGQSREAIFYGKQAINVFQQIRGSLKSFEKESQLSFLKDKESGYRLLADLLIETGRLGEAEQVLALLKEEEYAGLLRRSGEPKSDLGYTVEEAELLKIQSQLADLGRERNELSALSKEELNQKGKKARLNEIERRLLPKANAALERALEAIEDEIFSSDNSRKRKSRQSQVIAEVEDRKWVDYLDPATVALYTVIISKGELIDKGWIILVTRDFRKAYSIDVTNLNQTIAALRETLKGPIYFPEEARAQFANPQPLAHEIYRRLFLNPQPKGPTLAEDLETYLRNQKEKTLMWSLDGILRYVPMAVLHDGEKYLVERYRNVVFTTVGPALTQPVSRQWRVLGLAVSKKHPGLDPLPSTPLEMAAIVRDQNKNTEGVLPGVVKLDDQFTEEAMLDGIREGYPVVHIASHFIFDEANSQRSFLLLGDGNHLETFKLKDSANIFEKQDLVTLSACDTAMGRAGGKDTEGFAYVAQTLGAKAVLATLWKVDDTGTQVLMPRFYRLREGGLSKGEALRRAQLELLYGDDKSPSPSPSTRVRLETGTSKLTRFVRDPQRPFAHPYYWAPFILIGNWK